jgi:alkylation response protein AidB-like acyl-CoA dehydrogenase
MRLELTDDQEAFRDTVRRFANQAVRPRAAQIDADDQFPRDLVLEAGARGLMGVTIPVDAGRDYVSYALAIEAIATASATLAVNNSLVAEVVAQFGTTAQRATWLRRLATGQTVGAFALSEPDAGTDAANQHTTATLDGGGYRLNGRRNEGAHRRCVTEEQRRPDGMPRPGIM